mmetsp:Transcript_68700/g.223668  ORF Transcript_68700/g.223668 Transcript_68700/m.223668 type:complete len:212 (+) Transcript_68700:1111-1746(+)
MSHSLWASWEPRSWSRVALRPWPVPPPHQPQTCPQCSHSQADWKTRRASYGCHSPRSGSGPKHLQRQVQQRQYLYRHAHQMRQPLPQQPVHQLRLAQTVRQRPVPVNSWWWWCWPQCPTRCVSKPHPEKVQLTPATSCRCCSHPVQSDSQRPWRRLLPSPRPRPRQARVRLRRPPLVLHGRLCLWWGHPRRRYHRPSSGGPPRSLHGWLCL